MLSAGTHLGGLGCGQLVSLGGSRRGALELLLDVCIFLLFPALQQNIYYR